MQRITLDSDISYIITEKELNETIDEAISETIHDFVDWVDVNFTMYVGVNQNEMTLKEILEAYKEDTDETTIL